MMAHRSRLAGFIIDCRTDDLAARRRSGGRRSATRGAQAAGQVREARRPGRAARRGAEVDHPSRVHLDIESDDIPAEVARLERLGAKRIASVRTWVVMEAPTGHRFCVIRAQTKDFDAKATTTWEDGA